MNITKTPQASPRRTLTRSLSVLAAALFSVSTATAADWYLSVAQPFGNTWHTSGDWNTGSNGAGANASAISAADTYHINNYALRTPPGAGPAVFGGAALRLSGGTSHLAIKTTGVAGATIPKFESVGGKIENSEAGTVYLYATHFNNISGSTQLLAIAGRSIKLTADTLIGSGELQVAVSSTSTAYLALSDARRYVGQIRLTSGILDFDSPVSSSGALVIEGGKLVLDQPITVTSLKIGAATLFQGTYTYDTLRNHGTYGAYFANVTGTPGSITVKPATTWYLSVDQPNPKTWADLEYWKSLSNGTGDSPTEIRAADTFDTNGKDLRTSFLNTVATTDIFDGRLKITNPATVVALKASGTVPFPRIHELYTECGEFQEFINSPARLRIDNWTNHAPVGKEILFRPANGVATGGYTLSIGKLTGPGTVRFFSGNATYYLSVEDAGAYTGDIALGGSTLDFDNDLRSAGRLVLSNAAKVVLDQTVAFTEVLINGVTLPVGTYSYDDLHNHPMYGTFFPSGTSTGKLIVREPLNWYLTRSQTNATDSWNTVLHWSSEADGSGPSPTSINLIDNYVNEASNRTVRAPNVTSTFDGGALVLKGGAKLMLQAPASAITTIPTFVSEGNATIYNGIVGVQQTLSSSRWEVASGLTALTTNNGGAGGSLKLNVHHLLGAGGIAIGGGSHVLPYINHGAQFTGTFTVNTGASLTVNQTLGLGGSLVIQSGATVVLNKPIYARGLTVAGVAKALGTYSVAQLGAGFSGAGNIVVYQPSADSPQMFGVNLAGGEFTASNQWPDTLAVWQYYHSKGLTLVRMPVKWNRIQSSIGSSTAVNFTKMDQCIAHAEALGMKVIIDLHSYGAYGDGDAAPRLGSSAVPISAFVNLWSKIADHYKNSDAIYGYDLMNEPHKVDLPIWIDAVQQAIDAIREKDTRHYILAEGLGASGAGTWQPTSTSGNATMDFRDPIGRLVYSAHSYWDFKHDSANNPPTYVGNNGVYETIDIPAATNVGVLHVKSFVDWLKNERPYAFGNVGEFGIPHNHAHTEAWKSVLQEFLQYLRDNNMSATYWAGGAYWGNYPLSCHPLPFPGVDKPQMLILQQFNNNP